MSFPNPSTQFRPGQSGNPSGRPKGRSLTAILREVLDATEIGGSALPDDKRVADVVIEALIGHAVAGDAALLKEILNRVDGKVPDKVQVQNVPPEIDDATRAEAEAKLKQWRDKMRAEIPDTPPSSPLAPPTPPISSMNSAS